ncbi:hypothetical protein F5Y05DRAFT_367660 [Hypoxylon sp. FL0543]|nr:hypothetical protein F5Y05DRAFT_367660 [Hypoxylon sp. FL0543]
MPSMLPRVGLTHKATRALLSLLFVRTPTLSKAWHPPRFSVDSYGDSSIITSTFLLLTEGSRTRKHASFVNTSRARSSPRSRVYW